MTTDEPGKPRPIRSFVLRAGRTTQAQRRALEELAPRFALCDATRRPSPLDLPGIFGRRATCVLEIGFGNGDNLAALAESSPDVDFLGAEVHPPGVGQLLLAAEARQLRNLRVFRGDAVELLRHWLPPQSLGGVVILFPDPWHKARHHKRRLVQAPFLELLASRIASGGRLALATDWQPYADAMLEAVARQPAFRNLGDSAGWSERPAWRVVTRFERRGERLGHVVRDLVFERA
jgi:tRNA (guanine-N7-)-methyltransferase